MTAATPFCLTGLDFELLLDSIHVICRKKNHLKIFRSETFYMPGGRPVVQPTVLSTNVLIRNVIIQQIPQHHRPKPTMPQMVRPSSVSGSVLS